MRNLIKHIKEEWYKYFLEILVLIIGIYGAFALDSWNEDRKSDLREKLMLRLIMETLERDLEYAFALFEYRNEQSTKRITEMLNECPYDSIRTSALTDLLTFQIDKGPYEQLQSIGMDLISNDSLSNEILSTFNNLEWFHNQIHNELNQKIKNHIQPFVFEHFKAQRQANIDFKIIPKDYNALKENPDWITILALRLSVNRRDSILLQNAKQNMAYLNKLIKEELDQE